jgi:riboflavin kinase/FMN adenylyltransferase
VIGKEEYKGVMSIGFNPTVNSDPASRTIEANIFDFDKDIYGSEITVILKFRLRDEMKFSGLAELSSQIGLDKKKALSLLG